MLNKMPAKKGIIFTLDAIFALITAVTIIVAVIFYMGQVYKIPYTKQALNRLAQDSLTILEKDGALKEAIERGSSTAITTFLNSLPYQICGGIDLKSANHSVIQSLTKTNCTISEESVVGRRTFVANNFTTYYAEVEFWYTKHPAGR